MAARRASLSRGIVTGLVAGITATVVMDQFQKLSAASREALEKQKKRESGESEWAIAHEKVQQQQQQENQEGSTEIVARKIAQVAGTTLPKEQKKQAGQMVHYTFGTLMGVAYCVTAELMPEATTGGGTAFGTMLFLGADEIAVPAFRLAPPPTKTDPDEQLGHWAAHVVYGGTLELVRSLLGRLF